MAKEYIMDEPTLDLIVRLGHHCQIMAVFLGLSMGLNLALLLLLWSQS